MRDTDEGFQNAGIAKTALTVVATADQCFD